MTDDDRDLVSAVLASMPPPVVRADFVARVNARIDAEPSVNGWLGLADFRVWTLRLVPAVAALALIAVLWPATSSVSSTTPGSSFSPASVSDWQRDISANALLEAALGPIRSTNAR
jgi:hypothetical protein